MNEILRTPPVGLLPWAPERAGPDSMASPAPPPPRRPLPGIGFLWLPLRLAWRQLRAEKSRLASAIAGVMFACVLVFMQLGFRAALFDSATALLANMKAELFLIHPLTTASFRPEPIPRVRAYQTLADPEVAQAVPIYLAQATFRNPVDGSRRAVQMIGFDPESGAIQFDGLAPLVDALKRPDTVAFDGLSRPEFGPIGDLVAALPAGSALRVQIGNRNVDVVGMVTIGPSFGADGNAVSNEVNFRRIVSERRPTNTDLVALRLAPGADPAAVQARLRRLLPPDVNVLTHAELVAHERNYWETATPIGFIFAFGSLMGLIVGMVIVYQILFSDIANHLREYATLKAIGYSNFFLARVVMSAALILAGFGFLPGAVVSAVMYDSIGAATFLPLGMTMDRGIAVFIMIFTMCGLAGLLAMRKLRAANPADMF